MNSKYLKRMKKIVASVTVGAIILTGVVIMSTVAEAAEEVVTETGILYKPYSKADFEKLVGKTAPTYEGDNAYGYLFGGWYAEAKNEDTALKSADDVNADIVYAKFVPSYVMGVKCQNHSTTSSESTKTSMRIVSSVDSENYSEVGYIIERVYLNTDGSFNKKVTISDGTPVKIYTGYLNIYDKDEKITAQYKADAVFGQASAYFTAANLINISNFDMVISVQPYWKTPDGVTVLGLTRYVRVNDGVNGYVSIPVNLSSATDVAAGLLSIDITSMTQDNYTFVGAESGKVFEEMSYSISANTVKCVGNISNISANAKSNDIYVNLRFKAPDTERTYSTEKFYQLPVSGESFTNIAEDTLDTYKVWDVQY